VRVVSFIAGRLAMALATVVVISAVAFLVTNVLPADPARSALGRYATAEQVAAYGKAQGLDKPVLERYGSWVTRMAGGDWGTSLLSPVSVGSLVGPRLARTAILAGVSMLLAVAIAFAIGVAAGQRAGRPLDGAVMTGALVVGSLPEFVIGLVLLVLLGVQAGLLPIESSAAGLESGWPAIEAYILPVLTLTIALVPYMARMVRANVRDVSTQPFVRSAALRGVGSRRIVWRHVVPNASLPVVNVVALSFAELIGGVVVIETVFGFPGVGKLLVEAVSSKDIPVVQAITIVVGVAYVVANLAADLVVVALNPRLRGA
jgi:peptide/nickel transport system permease protein